MKKKLIALFVVLASLGTTTLNAQSEYGVIKGRLLDSLTKAPIQFGSIMVLKNNQIILGATSDLDGYYSIKPLLNDVYTVKTSCISYNTTLINKVKVNAGKMTYLDITASSNSISITGATIYDFKNPLIDRGQISTIQILETEDIENAPYMDVKQGAAISAGIYQKDDGGSIFMRGAREDGTAYYIDGIRVIGDFRLPKIAVKEMRVLTGGIPANIGDVTGGVVLITTKGYSNW